MTPVGQITATTSSGFLNEVAKEEGAGRGFDNKQNSNKNKINADGNAVELMTRLTKDDSILLEKSAAGQTQMHKSHSSSAVIRPKPTIINQKALNGGTATSLTGESVAHCDSFTYFPDIYSEKSLGIALLNSQTNCDVDNGIINDVVFHEEDVSNVSVPDDMDEREETLLLPDSTKSSMHRESFKRNYSRSSSIASGRQSMCCRMHAYITRNWYFHYLVPVSILMALMLVAYLTRDYAKRLLYWVETQNPWVIFVIFLLLFVIVSFPVFVGYFVLLITSGYLFGFFKGLFIVILGANVGIAFAHVTIRCCRHRIPLHRFIKNETGHAILRVISGTRAFKVVLLTRLTPIPFGLQNAIFSVSSINPRIYHLATFIGLLPAQAINTYLGSTLRSMHEVLKNQGTAVTGYISFAIEAVCGVALMFWAVQKARKELSETLLSGSDERKSFDVQV